MNRHIIRNPIIGGFYPDPSICRAGEDFYLVASSFELYPGIPIFHSRDLANWEQIGYVMTKSNGFHVGATSYTGGVMAPTIRYHKGTFYVINTNFADRGNYIVTATDPKGPWSEPHWLSDVPGIDASLFFDDDGKAYIIGTGMIDSPESGKRERGIYLCEFDIENMKTIGQPKAIWNSALRNAASPEAPHIYKRNGWYYLLIAEGGTEHYHSVAVARSRDLFGWYEGNPANPVLTHRHLGFNHPIDNVGHADMVELEDGSWYAVLLGSRIIDGQHKNLGRETYIVPVAWERDWPIFSPGSGKVEWTYPAPLSLPWTVFPPEIAFDDFDSGTLALPWSFWGTPYQDFWSLHDGMLELKLLPRPLVRPLKRIEVRKEPEKVYDDNISLIGRRQRHISYTAAAKMIFEPRTEQETAGLFVMQACNHMFRVERALTEGKNAIRLVMVTTDVNGYPHMPNFTANTTETTLAVKEYEGDTVIIKVIADRQDYSIYFGPSEDSLTCLYENADGRLINPEIIGGMVGTLIGMFASSNNTQSGNSACFDWFLYSGSDD
jgi:beta-xylosidase